MAKLTYEKFIKYQNQFYTKVMESPATVMLKIAEVIPGTDLQTFVGDSTRTTQDYELHCLYNQDNDTFERANFGLSETASGSIYLSPLELIPIFNTFIIDRKKTRIFFQGHEYLIDKITYMETLFDSCIAVEIMLKEAIHG